MTPKACPRCRGRDYWRIQPVLEHASLGGAQSRMPLAFKHDLAPLRTDVCAGCGFTVWHSGGAPSLTRHDGRYRRVRDPDFACRECDGIEHYHLEIVEEQGQRGGAYAPFILTRESGLLGLVACHGCGLTEWYARLVAPDAGEPCQEQCRHCFSLNRRFTAPVREDGDVPLPVAWPRNEGEREIGHFELQWCAACGLCDWLARDLGRLSADGEYIRRVKAAPPPRAVLAGGPYR
jgi:predicted nucleic-acid-binding Zn-ribbon protein